MENNTEKYDLAFTQREIWDLVFALQRDLEDSLKTHWINWIENRTEEGFTKVLIEREGSKYKLFKFFSEILNRTDLIDDFHCTILKEYNRKVNEEEKWKENNLK